MKNLVEEPNYTDPLLIAWAQLQKTFDNEELETETEDSYAYDLLNCLTGEYSDYNSLIQMQKAMINVLGLINLTIDLHAKANMSNPMDVLDKIRELVK